MSIGTGVQSEGESVMAKSKKGKDASDARGRVLDAAERLYALKGYDGVRLRDIASEAGIDHSSIYFHAPGGKESLYVEVMVRLLERHRDALSRIVADSEGDLLAQLRGYARWIASNPPVDTLRMRHVDYAHLDRKNVRKLGPLSGSAFLDPIEAALRSAHARDEIREVDFRLAAGGLYSMLLMVHAIPAGSTDKSHEQVSRELVDIFLHGLTNASA